MSEENGIWLCSVCAAKIDRDVPGHSVELLLDWKRQAVESARAEIGKRPPSHSDAIKLLTTALSGAPLSLAPSAISNVHAAAGQALEALDSRFSVDTSYKDRVTTFTVTPNTRVDIHLSVSGEAVSTWRSQIAAMRDHGEIAELPLSGATISGSPLIETVLAAAGETGKLQFSPKPNKAILRLTFNFDSSHVVRIVETVHGELSLGLQTMTFRARLFDGLATVMLRKSLTDMSDKGNFIVSADIHPWQGLDVRFLPHFDDTFAFVEGITASSSVDVKLECFWRPILGAVLHLNGAEGMTESLLPALRYTRAVREICSRLGHEVLFTLSAPLTAEDHVAVLETADILLGKRRFRAADLNSDPTCEVVVKDEASFIQIMAKAEPVVIRFVALASSKLRLFDSEIDLPPIEIELDGVIPRIVGSNEKVKEGDLVKLEFLRQPNFQCVYRFLSQVEPAPIR